MSLILDVTFNLDSDDVEIIVSCIFYNSEKLPKKDEIIESFKNELFEHGRFYYENLPRQNKIDELRKKDFILNHCKHLFPELY